MIAWKFTFILISLLAHCSLYHASMQCGRASVTRKTCETAYKSIQYTDGGVTGGENIIIITHLDCLIMVTANEPGAAMQQDIEAAFREIFDTCHPSQYAGAKNAKHTFMVEVSSFPPDDVPFGSELKIGIPACKKSRYLQTKGLIKPEDCISAINSWKLGTGTGGFGMVVYQTCSVAVSPLNGLDVTLDLQTLTNMVKSITDSCKQDNGVVLNNGGSYGLNAKILIEIGSSRKA